MSGAGRRSVRGEGADRDRPDPIDCNKLSLCGGGLRRPAARAQGLRGGGVLLLRQGRTCTSTRRRGSGASRHARQQGLPWAVLASRTRRA